MVLVKLNVGGETFLTTEETITKEPDSMLSRMFKGEWETPCQQDEEGRFFIDRDGSTFKHILAYLRAPEQADFGGRLSDWEHHQLLADANFFLSSQLHFNWARCLK
ncbi:hypothetical protein WJX74_010854 [Apatococcus lobatus]|uniref:Potassium channel tetramerisation-type BTB domain-containing protein n=1 Tax=Apatococcus lobatus TaxID=904363 RepID=A0AAW1RTH9_9CHLO